MYVISNKQYDEERDALTVRCLSPATDSNSYTSKTGWVWTTTGQFYGSDEIWDIYRNVGRNTLHIGGQILVGLIHSQSKSTIYFTA
jgi:hypothetical protein